MAGATYSGCSYEGGFKGMKPSGGATLALTADQFVLRRPRVFFSRSLYKIWAKWTAVTDLVVEPSGEGSRILLTTKARGTGEILVADVAPSDLWEVLDELADLKDRFHTGETTSGAAAPAAAPTGDDLSDDAGKAESEPTGAEPEGEAARQSLEGEDVSGDADGDHDSAKRD